MVTSPYGMLPMMGNSSFAKEAASPSVAELSWLIVGLVCTGSDSTPAEPNGHVRETTELHMLNIYSSIKEVVYHIMQPCVLTTNLLAQTQSISKYLLGTS